MWRLTSSTYLAQNFFEEGKEDPRKRKLKTVGQPLSFSRLSVWTERHWGHSSMPRNVFRVRDHVLGTISHRDNPLLMSMRYSSSDK